MIFTYCPHCGEKETITRENPSNPTCQKCKTIFWNNPSATVAVIFRNDGKLLFAKRGIEPNKGMYDFPGGFVDYNEDIYQACVREIKEETTVDVRVEDLQLLTGYTSEYLPTVSVVDLVFLVRKWQGEFVPHDDVAALEWKPVEFINDEQFAVPYAGLAKKLAALK
jgi:ADP-ribose pyrophosphatase YjhB (NUDIX family)